MTIEETIAAAVAAEVRPVLEELRAIRTELRRGDVAPTKSQALLTVDEVAERCGGRTSETVRAWIHTKKLTAQKVGSRYLVKPEDLERYLAGAGETKPAIDSEQHLAQVIGRINRMGSK